MQITDRLALMAALASAIQWMIRNAPLAYASKIDEFAEMIYLLASKSDDFIAANIDKFNEARVEASRIVNTKG